MKLRTTSLLVSISSLGLIACAGLSANTPEKDPWAGYEGTHATVGRTSLTSASMPAPASASAPAQLEAPVDAVPVAMPTTKAKTAAAISKATIRDESISSIDVDTLGEVTSGSLGGKVVSSEVVVGAKYELVEVQLKGATVQIIRAATKPDTSGPDLSAPKARHLELSKTEAAWYDADADVLVIVNSSKKTTSRKLLAVILEH